MSPLRPSRRRGLTLLELMVAATTSVLVIGVAFALLGSSLRGSEAVGSRHDLLTGARLVEARVRADLGILVRGSLGPGASPGSVEFSVVRPDATGKASSARFERIRYRRRLAPQGPGQLVRERLDAAGRPTETKVLTALDCRHFALEAFGPDPSSPGLVRVHYTLRTPGPGDRHLDFDTRFLQALAPGGSSTPSS